VLFGVRTVTDHRVDEEQDRAGGQDLWMTLERGERVGLVKMVLLTTLRYPRI
jgi:hypothetical protein